MAGARTEIALRLYNYTAFDAQQHLARAEGSLFDSERVRNHTRHKGDVTFGIGMSFNGHVVVIICGGKVITVPTRCS